VLRSLVVAIVVAAAGAGLATDAGPVADLQYLQHSGWIVRTAEHVLVFDYVETSPQGNQLPNDLRVTPESFDKRHVVVFVSHGHADHFSPAVQGWATRRPDIQYVLGWPEASLPGAKVMQPHETWASNGLVVRATGSTDEGVGFLVTVDGLTFYHAGDHARWVELIDPAFLAEIQWLKDTGQAIDVAFFAIATGGPCEPRPAIWEGVRAAAVALAPRVLVPMHVGCADRLDLYDRFRKEIGGQLSASQVVAPTRVGESFRYRSGKMQPGN